MAERHLNESRYSNYIINYALYSNEKPKDLHCWEAVHSFDSASTCLIILQIVSLYILEVFVPIDWLNHVLYFSVPAFSPMRLWTSGHTCLVWFTSHCCKSTITFTFYRRMELMLVTTSPLPSWTSAFRWTRKKLCVSQCHMYMYAYLDSVRCYDLVFRSFHCLSVVVVTEIK